MIKFFRKIRQNLLSENQFSKYFIYAVGEIVLVVIGILIALQINNQNEYNKSYKSMINNLNQIKYELLQDINIYENDITYNDWAIKYFNHIKLMEFDSIDAKDIFTTISGNLATLDLSRSYNKLNDSGNIDIIMDSVLTNELHDYFLEERKRYNGFAKYNVDFTLDKIEGYLIYELPLDEKLQTTESAIIEEMENGKLINLINYQSGVFKISKGNSKMRITKAKNLIKLIEKKIKT